MADPQVARRRGGAFTAARGFAVSLALVACGGPPELARLEVWSHAGRVEERAALAAELARFERARGIALDVTWIPEGSYHAQVRAAAAAGDLPDLLELDGPYVALFAWQDRLRPLDGRLAPGALDDLLPSLVEQGTFRGRFYAAGLFDSGLGLWARRARLREIGARLPASAAEAWSVDELERILELLAARDPDGAVLDLKLDYRGEWFAYGFLPALESAGGGIIAGEPPRARGALDSAGSIAALARIQRWIGSGRVDANLDDAAFVDGRVTLSWVGHWEYPRYREAAGDDLALLPLPDFGTGSRTGLGSWCWAIPRRARRPDDAARLLEHLLSAGAVGRIAAANGGVPGTRAALAASADYGPGGPLRLYAEQLLAGRGVPRPRTPAYPLASSVFERAFLDLRAGTAPAARFGRAARAIDREIEDNRGYPPAAEEDRS
jgi:multiple sugar transport system substrate-binding protein